MGVKGLWRLLLPIGRRISIETLEGKILAIDASVWLTQFLKAMRDPETGNVRPAAHLIGFLRRLAKLRFHGIRPVLVFDGSTPEIKLRELQLRRQRREQFASASNANNLQRLAKRLLMEQLKQSKETEKTTGGAFAPGFQLEEDEEKKREETNETEKSSAVVVDDVLAESAELEATWNEPSNEGNDWDKPIDIDADDNSENDNDPRHRNAFFDSARTHDEDFVLDRISSLPSNMRKDAIEDAKRQQRMRSRREFMPVAGRPDEYSQTQLRNFLRSSRLNQKIVSMAQQEQNGDIEQVGERIASDSSRRIIFTKDKNEDKGATRRSTERGWKRLSKPSGLKVSERDADEELEWEDADMSGEGRADAPLSRKTPPTLRGRKSKAFVVDSDDESKEDAEGSSRTMETGGGFLLPASNSSASNGVAIHSPDIKEQHGGVEFIHTQTECASSGGFLPEPSSKSKSEQEVEDECLARTLQEGEDSAVSVPLTRVQHESNDQTTACKAIASSKSSDAASSDEDVDWQDGGAEDVSVSSVDRKPAALNINQQENTSSMDHSQQFYLQEGGTKDGRFNAAQGFNCNETSSSALRASVASATSDDSDKSDSVDEDGLNKPWADEDMENGNSKALAHAQETAAHLTDWAARAFRRAIAQHEEEQGLSHAHELTRSPKQSGPRRPVVESIISRTVDEEPQLEFESHQTIALSEDQPVVDLTRAGKRMALGDSPTAAKAPRVRTKRKVDDCDSAGNTLPRVLTDNMLAHSEEQRRQERDSDTITDEMKAEVIQLLQLFGIPYVEAPAEAEAQCVALEEMGLVDGVVTEDSDVFVFGGATVYKNIFDDQKYVEVYRAQDAKRDLALGRNEMVALAMLLGGDYTEGVKGVGIVNGMEILQAFDVSEDIKKGLGAFRQWLDGFDPSDMKKGKDKGDSPRSLFHSKHKSARTRWIPPPYFPADNVLNAYVHPVVDRSNEAFSWGAPDLDNLLIFCQVKLGWTEEETKHIVDPVIKRLEDPARQTRIESYFMKDEDNIRFAHVRSKRLQNVFSDIQTKKRGKDSSRR